MSSHATKNEAKHLTQIIDLPELKPNPLPGNPVVGPGLAAIEGVKVRLRAVAGEATLTVAELMELREDALLKLDRAVDDPIDILLDGKVVARGELVAVDDEFGIRITEIARHAK